MTPLNKKIIALRQKQYSFKQIAKELGCSLSTVSYALRKKTRDKVKKKSAALPPYEKKILNKIYCFKNGHLSNKPKAAWYINRTQRQVNQSISVKAHRFQRAMTFNSKDVLKKSTRKSETTSNKTKTKKPRTYIFLFFRNFVNPRLTNIIFVQDDSITFLVFSEAFW